MFQYLAQGHWRMVTRSGDQTQNVRVGRRPLYQWAITPPAMHAWLCLYCEDHAAGVSYPCFSTFISPRHTFYKISRHTSKWKDHKKYYNWNNDYLVWMLSQIAITRLTTKRIETILLDEWQPLIIQVQNCTFWHVVGDHLMVLRVTICHWQRQMNSKECIVIHSLQSHFSDLGQQAQAGFWVGVENHFQSAASNKNLNSHLIIKKTKTKLFWPQTIRFDHFYSWAQYW